jgi:hypothetical protein
MVCLLLRGLDETEKLELRHSLDESSTSKPLGKQTGQVWPSHHGDQLKQWSHLFDEINSYCAAARVLRTTNNTTVQMV